MLVNIVEEHGETSINFEAENDDEAKLLKTAVMASVKQGISNEIPLQIAERLEALGVVLREKQ